MKNLQKLPVTQSSFEYIRTHNLLYVDKTRQILTLLDKGQYLFLSRPRRFGKSLLLATLKALYQGKKALFKDLYIDDKWDWKEYPVIHLDFSNLKYRNTIKEFEQSLAFELDKIAYQYGVTLTQIPYLIKLNELVWKLKIKIGQNVVFLIDEYDKPITDFINNIKKAEENREFLKEIYAFLKGSQESIELVFVTGISKLAKVSVFSGMNNMYDLTLTPELNDVVGLTEEDIKKYFVHHLPVLAKKIGQSYKEILASIKYWYNGYSWDGINKIYNPYSIIHLFDRMEFENFWYTSGLSSLLVNLILKESRANKFKKHSDYYENVKATKSIFDSADISSLSIEGLLFHTGYLTIKHIERKGFTKFYHLHYPNYEVRWSFNAQILETFAKIPKRDLEPGAYRLKDALQSNDKEEFLKLLRSYFSLIPYQLRKQADESYYHSIFHILFTLLGIDFLPERSIERGRIDGVIVPIIIGIEDKICIVEFKYSTVGTLTALTNRALKQIKDNRYAQPYLEKNKPIHLLGVGFLEKDKNKPNSDWAKHGKLEIKAKWDEV